MKNRMFAIGFKGHVEIRVHTSAPRHTTSKTQVTGKKEVVDRNSYDWYNGYRRRIVPTKITIVQHTHTGGKVLGTLKSERFARLTNVSVRNGGMVELLPEQAEAVKEALGATIPS